MSTGTADPAGGWRNQLPRQLTAAWRGLVMSFLGLTGLGLVIVAIDAMASGLLGVGMLIAPLVLRAVQARVRLDRRLARSWSGVEIAASHRPEPAYEPGPVGWVRRYLWLVTDRATWRELAWLAVDATAGWVLVLIPAMLLVEGLFGVIQPFIWAPIDHEYSDSWYLFIKVDSLWAALVAVPLGAGLMVAGLRSARWWLRLHGRLARRLLVGDPTAELTDRVARLTETRSDAVDAQAAELRRIERDLHDGAQARLVAMGMNLGAVEELLERDPAAARALLAETREASARALDELRNLVRGIHPPVLADRGIGDAVRALALDHPLPVDVTVSVPGRPDPPVESAAYFAVSELLTNVAKHARASRAWVDLRYVDGQLRITVTDDGRGGARVGAGSGLRGITRRLGTFDGTLAVDSPSGGPTVATLELPCELSSPKISSS
jgi:signal transduction histidine kinase